MSTSTNSTFVSVRAILCIPKWAFPTKRMCKSCWSFCRSVMPFVNARGKSPFFHLFSYFSSFLLFPTLHSMCSPVQETYPDPQIVFKELKSLNVDNSDPENIKFTPKDWCLSCLGNLAILLHALGTGFRYFQIAFLGKTCWGSGIIQSQSHDMSQHEGIPVSNLLANFLSLRKPSNVTQKSQLRSRRLQGLCDGLCDVIKNIQRWIRMHSRLLC